MTPKVSFAVHLILLVSVVPLVPLAAIMALGRVRRNAYFGFRTPATLSDDRIWDPANRYAGRALLCALFAHALIVLLNLVGLLHFHVLMTIGLLLLSMLLAVGVSMLRLRRIVRLAQSGKATPRDDRE